MRVVYHAALVGGYFRDCISGQVDKWPKVANKNSGKRPGNPQKALCKRRNQQEGVRDDEERSGIESS